MPAKKSSQKSWQGRLSADADAVTADLLASIDIDIELWKYDIAGSLAHAQMLSERKLISSKEFSEIRRGLLSISADLESGKLATPPELEDIHMVIEGELIKRAGDAGRKLHTGRSRNDQVALDLRLWARDACDDLVDLIRELQRALVDLARRYGKVVMPAYTHLQRAQPIVAGQAFLAYVEMLDRDADRLRDARVRINVCPLGSGAVAGTSLPLDRQRVAELLGFPSITRNSIDATSDRDFLAELCFACAMMSVHLSRWAEDWIIYSTAEFGMIELHDAYCTSSSMMPQKKNADTLELIRGKAAAALASLTGILTLLKGLPLAYNRDLQDDKRFVFPIVKAMKQGLTVASGVVRTAKLDEQRITEDIDKGFLDATALAEYLTGKGVAFRQAHHIVGMLVASAQSQGLSLAQIPITKLKEAHKTFSADVYDHLGASNVVKAYKPAGAAGADQLSEQIGYWSNKLQAE